MMDSEGKEIFHDPRVQNVQHVSRLSDKAKLGDVRLN